MFRASALAGPRAPCAMRASRGHVRRATFTTRQWHRRREESTWCNNHPSRRKTTMSFCEHCEGQRFDRAQVLRALRAARKTVRKQGRACRADEALAMAIKAVRRLEIPHLERLDDTFDGQIVH